MYLVLCFLLSSLLSLVILNADGFGSLQIQRNHVFALVEHRSVPSIRSLSLFDPSTEIMCSKISTNLDSSETPHSRSARFELSKAQLQAYFSSIGLPPTHLSSPLLAEPLLACTQAHGLPFLAALMRHHLASIPYENLAIHYSSSREFVPSISMLDMQEIYSLIVERGTGRGGMCMQINGLFGTVLRSLGFEIMSTAARINTACQDVARTAEYEGPTYNGW